MDYRAYFVGADGHFTNFEVVTAEDDEQATEIAKTLVDGHDIELWQLDRKITVLSHKE
jgi:hypothetical protein